MFTTILFYFTDANPIYLTIISNTTDKHLNLNKKRKIEHIKKMYVNYWVIFIERYLKLQRFVLSNQAIYSLLYNTIELVYSLTSTLFLETNENLKMLNTHTHKVYGK